MSARLRHRAESAFPNGYASDFVTEPWPPGEERDVDAHIGLYLAEEHPESFELLRAPHPSEIPEPPPWPEPHQPGDLAALLRKPVAEVVYPIRQGAYDDHLGPLWILERAREGGPRKTVIDTILLRAKRGGVALEEAPVPPSPERPVAASPGEASPPAAPVDGSAPPPTDPPATAPPTDPPAGG